MWNEGRAPIHWAEVRQPLVISTEDHTPILTATLRKNSRPGIVELTLDESRKAEGRLGVSWDTLERHDGGIIQLIVAGKPNVRVKAEAVIEEQGPIHEAAIIAEPGKMWGLVIGMLGFIVLTVMWVYKFFTPVSEVAPEGSRWLRWAYYGSLILGPMMWLVISGYIIWSSGVGFAPTLPLEF